jgi:predicted outer membrane repeat protein
MKPTLLLHRLTYLCVFAVIFCSEVNARIIHVPGDSTTIQAGILGAVNGDTVLVNTGRYVEHINFAGKAILVTSYYMYTGDTLTIASTAIDGDSSGSVVTFNHSEDSTSVLNGFKITNGFASTGGGLYCEYASPTITNCWILDNIASFNGGGVFCNNTPPVTLIHCHILRNVAGGGLDGFGGGVFCMSYASVKLIDCHMRGNSASGLLDGAGGAIYAYYHSSVTLTNCQIIRNSATGNLHCSGGGIYCRDSDSSIIITDCTIKDNKAEDGGGIEFKNCSDVVLTNCTIEGNRALSTIDYVGLGGGICGFASNLTLARCLIQRNKSTYQGGAIGLANSSSMFTNCTITENEAEDHGGGIYCRNSSLTFTYCLIDKNSSAYGGAIYDSLTSRLILDSCCIVDNGNTGNSEAGLAHIALNTDTLHISNSHIYYNTFQPDTEIYNNTPITLPLENNFWWDTTDAGIASLIHGLADYTPWLTSMIPAGVPGEPLAIDSVRNYTDATYTTICDSIGEHDTLYIRIYGTDRNPCFREAGVVIMKSSIYASGIAVALLETDTSSGVYQGIAQPIERQDIDSIRIDDIYQRIGVNTSGDTIWIIANMDETKNFVVGYKVSCPAVIDIPSHIHSTFFFIKGNPAVNQACFSYYLQEGLDAEIIIYDISGRKVKEWKIKENNAQNELLWNAEGVSAGIYFVHFRSGSIISNNKFVLIK